MTNRPLELLSFLQGLTGLTLKHGIVIEGMPVLAFKALAPGRYCMNLNNTGPELGWQNDSPKL